MSNHTTNHNHHSRKERKGGIQELLAAEQRAVSKINEAKTRKIKKMKEARDEAQKEIDSYRKELQDEFEQKWKKDKAADEFSLQIQRKVRDEMRTIDSKVSTNKKQVIEKVLVQVYDITPELHENLQVSIPSETL
ncbi:V-type proton atpase subunit g [Oopsacas minuta]|uniref:V-type proton ATPase subunit G n=1 Tax=Oopsacas minuta TaxID=111878 RepID=A0AAV7K9R3_9METZ|nr:V-type proton atpase subunit g [Oopsacas minuta]